MQTKTKIMWAWYDIKNDCYDHIYNSELAVKLCSQDYFKSDIAAGHGEIVQVGVKRHIK